VFRRGRQVEVFQVHMAYGMPIGSHAYRVTLSAAVINSLRKRARAGGAGFWALFRVIMHAVS
jgi:hypothetical protein